MDCKQQRDLLYDALVRIVGEKDSTQLLNMKTILLLSPINVEGLADMINAIDVLLKLKGD